MTMEIILQHPIVEKEVRVTLPISRRRIPFDIFFSDKKNDEILVVRWRGSQIRRTVLERDEYGRFFIVKNGKIWFFAAVISTYGGVIMQWPNPYSRKTVELIPAESEWTFDTSFWRQAKK